MERNKQPSKVYWQIKQKEYTFVFLCVKCKEEHKTCSCYFVLRVVGYVDVNVAIIIFYLM